MAGSPSSPKRALAPLSPEESGERRSSKAVDLLREEDDTIATELPEIPPAVHGRDAGVGTSVRSKASDWSLRPQLLRAETVEERQEEEEHRRLGFTYRRYRIARVEARWYHPFTHWWDREVSVKVDVAKRRDHLGEFSLLHHMTELMLCYSSRAHVPGLSAYFARAIHDWRDHCPALSTPAQSYG
jgi:hypothetical protein